jgi:hypothetical protein
MINSKITNYKIQITNKFQTTNYKLQRKERSDLTIKVKSPITCLFKYPRLTGFLHASKFVKLFRHSVDRFVILGIVICDLFVIWSLYFVIFILSFRNEYRINET